MQTIEEMTQYITNFSLDDCPNGNQGFTRVLLQLFGFLGHGKSSFINSCKYILEDGEYKEYADVTKTRGGNTTARISYPLTHTLTLVDNRGCSVMNRNELGEIYAQLGNLLPLDDKVEFSKDDTLTDRIVEAESTVRTSDFIYPIFVYSVKKGLSNPDAEELKDLLYEAKELTGIFPMVILTHRTDKNFSKVKEIFENMEVEHIIPIKNFTPEDSEKTRGRHEKMLNIFIQVINDVKYTVERFKDPEEKRQKRKKFVLKYEREKIQKKMEDERSSILFRESGRYQKIGNRGENGGGNEGGNGGQSGGGYGCVLL